jgi:hypothetical protein
MELLFTVCDVLQKSVPYPLMLSSYQFLTDYWSGFTIYHVTPAQNTTQNFPEGAAKHFGKLLGKCQCYLLTKAFSK